MLLTTTLLIVHLPPANAKCPSIKQSWCLQVDGFDTIVLDGNRFGEIGLEKTLQKIAFFFESSDETKELDQLLLINNHALKVLNPNAFCDFHFRRIVISNCTNLVRVHPNAFNGTDLHLKQLKLDGIAVSNDHSEDFFDALNSLTNLEELELKRHKILKVHPYTFRQPVLAKLHLDGPLQLLENNAFYYLDSIRILRLSQSIQYVQQHAFDLKLANNNTLDIYIEGKLGIVERGIFTYTNRPLNINFFLNRLHSFDHTVFRPILMNPIRHELIFHGVIKEMHDPCQLAWLFRAKFYGVVTFKDEPGLNEASFYNYNCPEQYYPVNDNEHEIPEIAEVQQGGIDTMDNGGPISCRLAPVLLLPFLFCFL